MNGPGFYEFLIEAELQQYYNAFKNDLKVSLNINLQFKKYLFCNFNEGLQKLYNWTKTQVQNVAQLKFVSEDDMSQIGMSRPEMRRLTKYFHKHCPQTYLAKMKKVLDFIFCAIFYISSLVLLIEFS